MEIHDGLGSRYLDPEEDKRPGQKNAVGKPSASLRFEAPSDLTIQ